MTCEGCGEVWYPTPEEAKRLQDKMDGLLPPGCGTLTKGQSDKFIELAVGHALSVEREPSSAPTFKEVLCAEMGKAVARDLDDCLIKNGVRVTDEPLEYPDGAARARGPYDNCDCLECEALRKEKPKP